LVANTSTTGDFEEFCLPIRIDFNALSVYGKVLDVCIARKRGADRISNRPPEDRTVITQCIVRRSWTMHLDVERIVCLIAHVPSVTGFIGVYSAREQDVRGVLFAAVDEETRGTGDQNV